MRRRTEGLTVIELLIVMAVLGAILAVVSAFLVSMFQTTSATQARNEVEVNVRSAAELITQDLQLAGANYVVDTTGSIPVSRLVEELNGRCNRLVTSADYCVRREGITADLQIYYATSLRSTASEQCRRVEYRLEDGILSRSDVSCAGDAAFHPLVENVTAFEVEFLCEEGTSFAMPEDCYTERASFPQQASIRLAATSSNTRENKSSEMALSTTMPNLRPIAVSDIPEEESGE